MQTEKTIEFNWENNKMHGFLHQPIKETNKLLIMHHGFTGTSIDAHFMFTRFARFLAAKGIAVLRYDFVGSGNSVGNFFDMTFTDELKQAQYVFDQVTKWEWVEKIYIHGFSMGGAIASKLAGQNASKISKLLLWSPAGTMPDFISEIINTIPQLENGNYDYNGLELGNKFVNEILRMDMFKGIGSYRGPVQIIHGMKDQIIPVMVTEIYEKTYEQSIKVKHIAQADHTYSSLMWLDTVFQTSEEFLNI